MFESAALLFFRRVMEKMRIPTHIVHLQDAPDELIDMGLRNHLGRDLDYEESLKNALSFVEENTIYKVTDLYCCSYVYMILPETGAKASLVIGPYLSFEMDQDRLLEEAARIGVPGTDLRTLESYYQNLTILQDETTLMPLLNTLAEDLWGSEQAYRFVDTAQEPAAPLIPFPERKSDETSIMQMQVMEQRYAYENELLDKVSKGLWHRVSRMLNPTNLSHLESRTPDPVRNQKNFCIVCNTLLRKAAEQGGVHPFHLNRVSAHYARQIELVTSLNDGQELMQQMAQDYCRLVRRYNIQSYSGLIQKVITYIDAELASDLSLSKLAKLHNVSPEYLSSLFHKETGKTLTQFINEKRVFLGAGLLRTTTLQIQTIAEYCGFLDAGYFAKVFKKHLGISPKAYREHENLPPVK